ncbi:DUF4197 domain-containing protein [Pseudomonas sp. RIT-PI-AD]|uniref:DUF4197 domain-containing protein n=1 Tax=Pseudomonas sp. RIT-PI-AD TaxID=3035294 RepID=UPI0021DAC5DF|nr:DUF4197 domain-containing protein [Pseudomonas sp. RIT-PI-AD]
MFRPLVLLLGLGLSAQAFALSLADLTQQEAGGGLKDVLTQSASLAVQQLSKPGGFAKDPALRIELPGKLGKAARTLKAMGMGSQVEQLENGMNQAAEAAMPQARALLVDAVKKMSVQDARSILAGSQDAATRYLDSSSREQLRTRFLPIVRQATAQVGLASQYNAFAGQAARLGVVETKNASLESYVTEQALDGLFTLIARQEANIRQDPLKAATGLAQKVLQAGQTR